MDVKGDGFSKERLVMEWSELSADQRVDSFFSLSRIDSEEIFLTLSSHDQYELISKMTGAERRSWLRLLALDDAADLIQQMTDDEKVEALTMLDPQSQREVQGLLVYAEDRAGGLMTPHYLRLRPDMTVDQAFAYIRAHTKYQVETIYYAYVIDNEQKLLGAVSFRELVLSPTNKYIHEVMKTPVVTVPENLDQEEVSRVFGQNHLMAIPVVDSEGRMKGIVTYDDIVNVVQKEATEDIQKLGGMEALDAPYMKVRFFEMVQKRGSWIILLFFGELLTASAMGYYESTLERMLLLAMFIPVIISSGGNSGSQATTLIIRALALQEISRKDWIQVFWRELGTGLCLGLLLGTLGLIRVLLWNPLGVSEGDRALELGLTVGISLVGVVLWGTVTGSMLPFVLKYFKLDPASASAPLVATIVDVTGLIIYFTVAKIILLP